MGDRNILLYKKIKNTCEIDKILKIHTPTQVSRLKVIELLLTIVPHGTFSLTSTFLFFPHHSLISLSKTQLAPLRLFIDQPRSISH